VNDTLSFKYPRKQATITICSQWIKIIVHNENHKYLIFDVSIKLIQQTSYSVQNTVKNLASTILRTNPPLFTNEQSQTVIYDVKCYSHTNSCLQLHIKISWHCLKKEKNQQTSVTIFYTGPQAVHVQVYQGCMISPWSLSVKPKKTLNIQLRYC
jgi:hypothetical protein